MVSQLELVLEYITATQRARSSQAHADFEAIRHYLADDIEIRLASPWTEQPWRTAHAGADVVIERLRESVNAATRLTTETVNAAVAGDDVLVEQVSTLHTSGGDKVSCVAHLFTVMDERITRIRTYRNDAGLPSS